MIIVGVLVYFYQDIFLMLSCMLRPDSWQNAVVDVVLVGVFQFVLL